MSSGWTHVVKSGPAGRLYQDGEGKALLAGTPVPPWLPETRATPRTGYSTASKSGDWLPSGLEVAGWILMVLSVLGGLALYGEASSYGGSGDTGFALVVGAAGVVQSLLILAVARLVRSQSEAADNTRKMVELLKIAIERE